jgi:hypothetical protein
VEATKPPQSPMSGWPSGRSLSVIPSHPGIHVVLDSKNMWLNWLRVPMIVVTQGVPAVHPSAILPLIPAPNLNRWANNN